MNAFMSSGFTPKSTAKTQTPPVSETIKKIVPAPLIGQMLVYLMKFPGTKSYVIQWGVPGPGGALPATWSNMPVRKYQNSGNRHGPDARHDLRVPGACRYSERLLQLG